MLRCTYEWRLCIALNEMNGAVQLLPHTTERSLPQYEPCAEAFNDLSVHAFTLSNDNTTL